MKKMLLALIVGCVVGVWAVEPAAKPPEIKSGKLKKLAGYVAKNYRSPEDYIISKFADHDIVFLGERHRLRHDVQLVQRLIPLLYKNGVYNLGIEFADFVDQPLIDRLITGETYDEDLARKIQFSFWPFWGFQEYMDLYKVAWGLNRSLPAGAKPFRIVGLNADWDFSHVRKEEDWNDPEIMKKVWPNGSSDTYMAGVILREFAEKGEKALIYSGCNHAYTRYRQPYRDKDGKWVLNDGRMGNLVHRKIGSRCFNIYLHAPWPSAEGYDEEVLAADGYIDALIASLPGKLRRAGFDVKGSPFGTLPGATSYWHNGYHNFNLGMYCDGYVIQKPLKEYEGVRVIPGFINEENRLAAIAQSANPKSKDKRTSVEKLMSWMERDTEIQRIFKAMVIGY